MATHLSTCAPAHAAVSGAPIKLLQLLVRCPERSDYWLVLEAKAHAKLRSLDSFLRQIWLECCGHISAFEVEDTTYLSHLDPFEHDATQARSMEASIGHVFTSLGQTIGYLYDYGDTTTLELRAECLREGRIGRRSIRLLARNDAPLHVCGVCGRPATAICPYCLGDAGAFCCDEHRRSHACNEPESFLPICNSPRMGVCGYTGEV
ncbi:MAG: hypothetical protein Q8O14_00425 [bacterium]|jgi:hypothetical protein|nr:hypothetical protein [bacterium]